jgi:hypothetical protein
MEQKENYDKIKKISDIRDFLRLNQYTFNLKARRSAPSCAIAE